MCYLSNYQISLFTLPLDCFLTLVGMFGPNKLVGHVLGRIPNGPIRLNIIISHPS